MGLSDVSNILWRERQLLELLLFKLEEEQLILNSQRPRWLDHATREVETVISELYRLDLERTDAIQALATEMGMPGLPTLKTLAEQESGPWVRIFEEHRNALRHLATEIDKLANSNRDDVLRGQRAAHATLKVFGDEPRMEGISEFDQAV